MEMKEAPVELSTPGLGLLSETLKTIKDNTVVITELCEIVKSMKEGIARLPQSGESKAAEMILNDIKAKMESVSTYISGLGNIPKENANALTRLVGLMQEEILKNKGVSDTMESIDERLSAIANSVTSASSAAQSSAAAASSKLDQISKDIGSNAVKTDELSTWSKVKFPFIIGMITFVLWLASMVFMAGSVGGWIQEKMDKEVTPVMKQMQMLGDQLQRAYPPQIQTPPKPQP